MAKKKKLSAGNGGIVKKIHSFGPFNLAALALALAAAGQIFFTYFHSLFPGLVLYAAAVAAFSFARGASKKEPEVYNMEPWIEALVFLFIIAVAVFFRVYMADVLPAGCFRDEGQNGNEAINILNGVVVDGTSLPVYIERWTQNAAMYIYLVTASFKFCGIGVMQVRAVSIVVGILCVPAFYFLLRYLFGVRAAILGGFIMAVLRWHVNFSRIGFLGILTVFFVILCVYFTYRAYIKRKPFDFIMLGAVTALSLYTYIAARLIPVGIALFFIYVFIREPKFLKKHMKSIGLALAAFFIVILPLGIYVVQNPQNFMSRASTVSIFNQEMLHEVGGRYAEKNGTPKHWTKLYMENFADTMLMFNYEGDGNPRHNYGGVPMLDFVTGILAFLGFFHILFSASKPRNFLLLALFAAFLQTGLLSTESPQAYRTIVEIPIVIIFMVIAAGKIMDYAREQYGKEFLSTVIMAGIAVMCYSGYDNFNQYFDNFRKNPGSWAEFSTDEFSIGNYVKNLGEDWEALVQPSWVESYTFRFASYPAQNYRYFSLSNDVPIREKTRKNFAYVLDASYLPLLPVLEKMYPHGKYGDFKHKYISNEILYFTFEVPYEDVKKYQDKAVQNGLTGYYYRGIEWKGAPVFSRMDPFILFNWTIDPVMGPFSVKWAGRIKIEKPGEYSFMTSSNDYSDLYIDSRKVLENKGAGFGAGDTTGAISLSRGMHEIVLRYRESIHYSKMQFWWKNPDDLKEEVVPSEILFPEK
jgi:4-amino-4-deoxy-L-arabinose transferase-like glycosyltransferase